MVGPRLGARPAVELPERWQVGALEGGFVAEDHGPLDDVAQLPHIPRPIPGVEGRECCGVDRLDPLLELAVERVAEVIGEERQVALDLALLRHGQRASPDSERGYRTSESPPIALPL